jgi:hypothetical protein
MNRNIEVEGINPLESDSTSEKSDIESTVMNNIRISQEGRYVISNDDYENFSRAIEIAENKLKIQQSDSSGQTKPKLDLKKRLLLLPDTVLTYPDNILMRSMIVMARELDISVELLNYGDRRIKELTQSEWNFTVGLSLINRSYNEHITIKNKKTQYELGRTYARARQVLSIFSHSNLGIGALKKNNKFFGNSPSESQEINKKLVPVFPMKTIIKEYFIEEDWATELSNILHDLLKLSASGLHEDVQHKIIDDNIMPFSDMISLFGTRSVLISPQKGKRQAVYDRKVPHLMKSSPVLTSPENKIIHDLCSPEFVNISTEHQRNWGEYVYKNGFERIKKSIQTNMQRRNELLSKFGKLTTNRLNLLRNLEKNENLKKKDVAAKTVISLVSQREDPAESFAEELLVLDPGFEGVLSHFKPMNKVKGSEMKIAALKEIISWLYTKNIYPGKEKTAKTPEKDEKAVPESILVDGKVQTKIGNKTLVIKPVEQKNKGKDIPTDTPRLRSEELRNNQISAKKARDEDERIGRINAKIEVSTKVKKKIG